MHRPYVLAITLLAVAGCGIEQRGPASHGLPDLPEGAEAISLLGDTLSPPFMELSVREERERRLTEAQTAYDAAPEDPDSIIWLGRRLAYLGRYREAIETYTRGITLHPDDARLYRHRGHRYLTVRAPDLAIEDFLRATQLVAGRPDVVEPDGLPNARGIPTSTLQSNIWYHLGLAHYLRGDFERAASAYRECLKVSTNPDMLVATSHWLYMTLRRLGREEEAAAVLGPIHPDLDVIENHSYHRLLLLYRGELEAEALLAEARRGDALTNATEAYGIGNWYLYGGGPARAREIFREILEGTQWAAFGYLAAEAELARAPGG